MVFSKTKQSIWRHPSTREAVRLIAGEHNDEPVFNLEQDSGQMPIYRAAIFRLGSAFITLLTLPYAIGYAIMEDYPLAIGVVVAGLPMVWHCWRMFYCDKEGIPPLWVMLGCVTALLVGAYFNHDSNIFWAPALLVMLHFVLPRNAAIPLSILCYALVVPLVFDVLPVEQALVLLLGMLVSSGGACVFSMLVSRQDRMLQEVAVQDPLTHAYNRRYLMESLEQTFELHQRYQKQSSLIMLDIDHFKPVNDQFGHGEGDRVLKDVVHLLQRRLRRTDSLYRYGGEEFVILLNETDAQQAYQLAWEFCALVREAPILPDRSVTVSCGVAELTRGENPLGWLARSDEALYRAKRGGRNRTEMA